MSQLPLQTGVRDDIREIVYRPCCNGACYMTLNCKCARHFIHQYLCCQYITLSVKYLRLECVCIRVRVGAGAFARALSVCVYTLHMKVTRNRQTTDTVHN